MINCIDNRDETAGRLTLHREIDCARANACDGSIYSSNTNLHSTPLKPHSLISVRPLHAVNTTGISVNFYLALLLLLGETFASVTGEISAPKVIPQFML